LPRTWFDFMQVLYGATDGDVRVHVVDGPHREAREARERPMHRRLFICAFRGFVCVWEKPRWGKIRARQGSLPPFHYLADVVASSRRSTAGGTGSSKDNPFQGQPRIHLTRNLMRQIENCSSRGSGVLADQCSRAAPIRDDTRPLAPSVCVLHRERDPLMQQACSQCLVQKRKPCDLPSHTKCDHQRTSSGAEVRYALGYLPRTPRMSHCEEPPSSREPTRLARLFVTRRGG
jgi:hypothetical protein